MTNAYCMNSISTIRHMLELDSDSMHSRNWNIGHTLVGIDYFISGFASIITTDIFVTVVIIITVNNKIVNYE